MALCIVVTSYEGTEVWTTDKIVKWHDYMCDALGGFYFEKTKQEFYEVMSFPAVTPTELSLGD